jgi:hypothetical protein
LAELGEQIRDLLEFRLFTRHSAAAPQRLPSVFLRVSPDDVDHLADVEHDDGADAVHRRIDARDGPESGLRTGANVIITIFLPIFRSKVAFFRK